ncbi:hypothetical protein [Streptomyces rapamycinicus]
MRFGRSRSDRGTSTATLCAYLVFEDNADFSMTPAARPQARRDIAQNKG